MKKFPIKCYTNQHGVTVAIFINEDGIKEYHLSYDVDDDVTFKAVTTTMTEEEVEEVDMCDLIDLEDEMEENLEVEE